MRHQKPKGTKTRNKILAALTLTTCILTTTHGAQQKTQDDQRPVYMGSKVALKIAIDHLKKEGQRFRETDNLPRDNPDFAPTFPYTDRIKPIDLRNALCQIQSPDDPVIDSYIRWQLLSFNPDLDTLDDQQFEQMCLNLPALLPPPPADKNLQTELETLAQKVEQKKVPSQKLQNRWESVQISTKTVERLNHPSLLFRKAVIESMPDTGPRSPILMLHDLEDRIEKATDTRWIKTRITSQLKKRKLDNTISPEQRWELIQFIDSLTDQKTKIIREIIFYANTPAIIRYTTYTVRSNDAKKWTAYLNRHDPI